MVFKTIIHDVIPNITPEEWGKGRHNDAILWLVNDFEDWKWRYSQFQEFVWDNIAESALSKQEREALINKPSSTLAEAAKKLRLTDESKQDYWRGSELAEIVLYWIMRHYYGALPIVPKIFYKQNSQDYAKWADSVHIVIDQEDLNFSIWLWEAKFYGSLDDGKWVKKVIDSIKSGLTTEKLRKENSIITNLNELNSFVENKELLSSIYNTLSWNESIDAVKPKLNIPILLLHECELTALQTNFNALPISEMRLSYIKNAEKYFSKQIMDIQPEVYLFEEIKFHLILLAVPSKDGIVDNFIETAKFHRSR